MSVAHYNVIHDGPALSIVAFQCFDRTWIGFALRRPYALETAKLFPVRLDDTPLPLRFIHVHTLNLAGWDGIASHDALQALVAHLHEAIGKPNT
jgi:hypothetical protein